MATGPLPPHHRYGAFLPEEELEALLAYALANRKRFRASTLFGGQVDRTRRFSEQLGDLGALAEPLRRRLAEAFPDILTRLGMRPFELALIELELAAHGDGAHFAPHIDLPVGPGRRPISADGSALHERLVSAVYYFHREPKGFSGGALRFHRFGGSGGEGEYLDLEPERNSLVVFPSWARHEVLTVHCPSGRFEDSRFALNAWFCRLAG
jgi:SM-20-related protein